MLISKKKKEKKETLSIMLTGQRGSKTFEGRTRVGSITGSSQERRIY